MLEGISAEKNEKTEGEELIDTFEKFRDNLFLCAKILKCRFVIYYIEKNEMKSICFGPKFCYNIKKISFLYEKGIIYNLYKQFWQHEKEPGSSSSPTKEKMHEVIPGIPQAITDAIKNENTLDEMMATASLEVYEKIYKFFASQTEKSPNYEDFAVLLQSIKNNVQLLKLKEKLKNSPLLESIANCSKVLENKNLIEQKILNPSLIDIKPGECHRCKRQGKVITSFSTCDHELNYCPYCIIEFNLTTEHESILLLTNN